MSLKTELLAKQKIEQQKEQEESNRVRYLKALKNLLNDVNGRRVLHHILEAYSVDAETFSSDALASAYYQGQQSVARKLRADIKELGIDFLHTVEKETL